LSSICTTFADAVSFSGDEQPFWWSNNSVSAIRWCPRTSEIQMTLCTNKYQRLRNSVGWAYLHEWGTSEDLRTSIRAVRAFIVS